MKRAAFVATTVAILGCGGGGLISTGQELSFEIVATGLEVPWAIVFTSADRMLVTERPGRVRAIVGGVLAADPLLVLTPYTSTEAGLMGIATHPDYTVNRFVYVSYVNSATGVRVERYRDDGTALRDPVIIIDNIPFATHHIGCRIKFGPDGKLYVTTGDAINAGQAQTLDNLAGKILRLNDDGSIPADNPFRGTPGARPEIWTYGHRNSQGIAWQPGTGLMFETEHGPSGGDEVNIIEAGLNYGWPTISHEQTAPGMVSPIVQFTPSVAPSGATFADSPIYPNWRGNLFFACLRGNALIRLDIRGRIVDSEERLATHLGRLRDVVQGPDGYLYITTSNRDGRATPNAGDDKVIRIVPR